MRALVTADWQVTWSNIEQCRATQEHMLQLCSDHKIKTVLHCGDLKQHYSPVDVRVVNYGVHLVETFKKNGIEFFILLGNHDRVSMSDAATNWFPALAAAGAVTIDRPRILRTADGSSLAAVPFMTDHAEVRTAVKRLAKRTKDPTLLLFHNELHGCKINVARQSDDQSLAVADLLPGEWTWCLGGHIHLHQQLYKNVYYVGSPFAQDWGEANQPKGMMLIDGQKATFIPSKLPGLYDPSFPGFKESKPASWKGASVRVHVAFDKAASTSYKAFIETATANAQSKYKGADITVVPEFLDTDSQASQLDDDGTDDSIVRAYVKKTAPLAIKNQNKLVEYLLTRLADYGALHRSSSTLKLISATATNFLSFKEVAFKYRSGITVVTGDNRDWPGRNNGSGKTNILQLPAVALFGRTLKGQESDQWALRHAGPKDAAKVSLKFRLSDGRLCEIHRQRKPTRLQLLVAGKDHSIGIGNRGTQAAIESLTGMSWQSLSNAMYIDQGEVTTILSGTDTERKAIFAKFLNLERFALARKACADHCRDLQDEHDQALEKVAAIESDIRSTKEVLKDLAGVPFKKARRIFLQGKASYAAAKNALASAKARSAKEAHVLKSKLATAEAAVAKVTQELAQVSYHVDACAADKERARRLGAVGVCPECKQVISEKQTVKVIASADAAMVKDTAAIATLRAKRKELTETVAQLRDSMKALDSSIADAVAAFHKQDVAFALVRQSYKEAKATQSTRNKYTARLAEHEAALVTAHRTAAALSARVDFEKYCVTALSKDGIPAFIAAKLCPRLNAAAKKYAAIFGEDEIQVRFSMREQDVDVEIINVHGGASLTDQSAGETRIAGIITGFAIRDVINPCNVLILDEPSESLDAANAKVFAEGLRQAAAHLGAVLLTTHNPYVLGELAGERLIKVTKRKGISTAKLQE